MGKHHSSADATEPIALGDLLPTMVITDYLSAMTVYQALVNAANDFRRLATVELSRDPGKVNDAQANRWIDSATRCRNLADMAYAEAVTIANATADANGYSEVI